MTYDVDIRNIAGIRSGEATVHPGINVVKAENWQGKSSFMTSLQVVMGTTGLDDEGHPLTDGASEGRVKLETDTGSYTTKLVRDGRRVRRDGEVYLTDRQDRTCAHLFAFLGEDNPVREAVRSEGDLAAQLTRPLDLENIDEQIARLKSERNSVEAELNSAKEAAEKLPSVQTAVTRLTEEIEELQAERDELATADETAGGENDELAAKRATKEQLRNQITTLENKIERQEDRLRERREELDDIEIPDEPALSSEIEAKQSRISELERTVNLLEDLYRVNKRIVDEDRVDVVTEVDRTLAGDEMECWICGSSTSDAKISDRLDAIDEQIRELRTERGNLRDEVQEIQDRRDEIRQRERRKRDLEAEVSELEVDLDENRSMLDDLEERLETVTAELETLAEEADAVNDKVTDYESEIKYKRAELEDKQDELSKLETEAERRDRLQDEYDDLKAEIETLRTRRKEKKRELASRFEATIDDIIDTFEPGFETARLTPKTDTDGRITDYELVVARNGQETSLDALSEGEVELLGIVTALAGYETFDVGDRVPLILLDGLTALSNTNFHALVEYLRDEAEMLVTTAYPEIDDFEGHVVNPHRWKVVSRQQSSAT